MLLCLSPTSTFHIGLRIRSELACKFLFVGHGTTFIGIGVNKIVERFYEIGNRSGPIQKNFNYTIGFLKAGQVTDICGVMD